MSSEKLTIGVVARLTGVEISTLRKWESRYGFPAPFYLASGQRRYTQIDLQMLQYVARRVGAGERAGKVIRELMKRTIPDLPKVPAPLFSSVDEALAALARLDLGGFNSVMKRCESQMSVLDFVDQFASPLAEAVGTSWAEGRLPIYGEHLFSTLLESMLVRIADQTPWTDPPPKVLLATLTGETHTLGLAMANAVINSAGISCLRLTCNLPVSEIAAIALAYHIPIVGISASQYYPPRLLQTMIAELKRMLPDNIQLWLGGKGVNRVKILPAGVQAFSSWEAAVAAFKASI